MISDAARHCSEAVNDAVHNGGSFMWVAIRLSDGKSDGIIYPTKQDAVNHQLWEFQCAYIKVPPMGMQPAEAERYLAIHRKLYDAGARLTDPDIQAITPYTNEHRNIFMRG